MTKTWTTEELNAIYHRREDAREQRQAALGIQAQRVVYISLTGPAAGVWTVGLCDVDGAAVKTYQLRDYDRALALAEKIAADRRLRVNNTAVPF